MEQKEKKEENPFKNFNINPSVFEQGGFELKEINVNNQDEEIEEEEEVIEDEIPVNTKTEEKKVEKKVDKKIDDSETEEVEDKKKVEETEASEFKILAEHLSEKGIIDFDPENFEDSEEGFEKAIQTTVQNQLDNFYNSLPDEFKQMLNFHQSGGDLKQFSKIFFEDLDYDKLDISEEKAQKQVVREALKLAGETEADIEDMITEWSDLGTLDKHAKRSLAKLKKNQEDSKQQLVEAQAKAEQKRKEDLKKEWDNYKEEVYSKDNILGFKVTSKMKDDLWKYITVANPKTGLTGLQEHNKNNKDAQLIYAYLAMNNWDMDKFKKNIKSEVSGELADKLKKIKSDTRTKLSKGKTVPSDDLEDNHNFSAFKSIL